MYIKPPEYANPFVRGSIGIITLSRTTKYPRHEILDHLVRAATDVRNGRPRFGTPRDVLDRSLQSAPTDLLESIAWRDAQSVERITGSIAQAFPYDPVRAVQALRVYSATVSSIQALSIGSLNEAKPARLLNPRGDLLSCIGVTANDPPEPGAMPGVVGHFFYEFRLESGTLSPVPQVLNVGALQGSTTVQETHLRRIAIAFGRYLNEERLLPLDARCFPDHSEFHLAEDLSRYVWDGLCATGAGDNPDSPLP